MLLCVGGVLFLCYRRRPGAIYVIISKWEMTHWRDAWPKRISFLVHVWYTPGTIKTCVATHKNRFVLFSWSSRKSCVALSCRKEDKKSLWVSHLNTIRQGLSSGLEYGIGQGFHTHVIESAKQPGASHVLRLVAWARNEHTDGRERWKREKPGIHRGT